MFMQDRLHTFSLNPLDQYETKRNYLLDRSMRDLSDVRVHRYENNEDWFWDI